MSKLGEFGCGSISFN